MSSSPTREPYYRTYGGTDLTPETYWIIDVADQEPFYFRFVEVQDTAGGLCALIQDEVGYKNMQLAFFDQYEGVKELTDDTEIALAMLAIHT